MTAGPVAAAQRLLLVVAVALVDGDGRVLLAQRPEGRAMAGLWEFPGGKVAPGETPEGALIRELAEELGIDTEAACLAPLTFASHAYPDFHLLMPLFVCRVWSGIPEPREGQRLAWVRVAEMARYEMPPADLPLVAMLRDLAVSRILYHLARGEEWRAAQPAGTYAGSRDDRRDGFLHFSTAAQVRASAARHRAGEHDVWLLAVPEDVVGPWRWEAARSGDLFPHLYAALPVAAVSRQAELMLDASGVHVFPDWLPAG